MSNGHWLVGSLLNLAGPDFIIIFALFFLMIPFVIWMIIDCALYETGQDNLKLVWLLIILFAPMGSLIYFFVRKMNRVSPPRLPQ